MQARRRMCLQKRTNAGQSFLRGFGADVVVGRDKVYRSSLASDGYATGFVIYVLRTSGTPASDPAIRRGIDWLKSHQRESGRWFTPSQGWHTQHYVSNVGSAFAVLALHACGEVSSPVP